MLLTAQSFPPLGKQFKPHQNRREVFFCFVVKFFNSTVNKDCFSQSKETASFHARLGESE